jgi:hypothetical protein
MRNIGLSLTGLSALAITGTLAVCVADPAFAKIPKSCEGKNQAYQNGQCVTTASAKPERALPTSWYRSHSQKNQKDQTKPKPTGN